MLYLYEYVELGAGIFPALDILVMVIPPLLGLDKFIIFPPHAT
jgi:hypothetical protein